MTEAFVAIEAAGEGALLAGTDALKGLPCSAVSAVSRTWVRADADPGAGEDTMLFAVARLDTELLPAQLAETIAETLSEAGAIYAKPTLLMYGDEEWVLAGLVLPHPRLLTTPQWAVPLLDVSPGVCLPEGGAVRASVDPAVLEALTALGGEPDPEMGEPAAAGETDEESCSPGSCADGSCGPKLPDFRAPVTDEPEEWVAVVEAEDQAGALLGLSEHAAGLLFAEAVLADAEIPCVWYPHRPGEGFGPDYLRGPQSVLLMVQPWRCDEAREALAAASGAQPEGEFWADDYDEEAEAPS
jgi:7,8-dihydro-6-hydroxymethylpterin-pyrophosphokinase